MNYTDQKGSHGYIADMPRCEVVYTHVDNGLGSLRPKDNLWTVYMSEEDSERLIVEGMEALGEW